MKLNKLIMIVLYIIGIHSMMRSQNTDTYYVNDKNVRLRDAPGLNGKIIRNLDSKEEVKYLSYIDLFDGSDFKWINISTIKEKGWMYGEYLTPKNIVNNGLVFSDDVSVKIGSQYIVSGMHESEVIKILGNPLAREFDEEYNEYTLHYPNDLIILVHKYSLRVHQIIIKNSFYCLKNNIPRSITKCKKGGA